MRRKEREVIDSGKIDEIIKNCNVIRLGFYDDENGEVYIVPLNFGFCENSSFFDENSDENEKNSDLSNSGNGGTAKTGQRVFYFHSAKTGRKIDLIKKHGANNKVGFELDINLETVGGKLADDYTTLYQSIIGTGTVSLVEEYSEKLHGLQALMLSTTGKSGWDITSKMVESVCMFKLVVSKISCKQNLG